MKKQVMIPVAFVILALVFAVGSAFSGGEKDKKIPFTPRYFHFDGSPGQEEDETLWSQITEDEYTIDYAGCNKDNDGCRLRTDSVQTVAGVMRPKLVEVNIVGTHKNPKTSLISGVTDVGQLTPNP